jgi:hypothetical protein
MLVRGAAMQRTREARTWSNDPGRHAPRLDNAGLDNAGLANAERDKAGLRTAGLHTARRQENR